MKHNIKLRVGPKYEYIHRYLKNQIVRKKLVYGQYLPPERQLARNFGMSIGTIKKALHKLKAENYIQRRRGHGTQVSFAPDPATGRKAIVILIGSIKRSFFAEIYSGIQAELNRCDCNPILYETQALPDEERRFLQKYRALAHGFLIAPSISSQNYDVYRQLMTAGVPFVFIDRYLPEINADAVVSDNIQGGYLAVRHLLQLGHRRIAVLKTGQAISVLHRIEGYRRALSEFGAPFDKRLVFSAVAGGFDAAYGLAEIIRAEHPDVTAAFCPRDDSAWGCLEKLREMGVKVPEEFSVIGFDDNEDICSRVRPRLTTVRQPKRQMGVAAAKLLLRRLESKTKGEVEIVSLPVELVVRESTGRLRSQVEPRG